MYIAKAKILGSLQKLINGDVATTIFIKIGKSSNQILLSFHLIQVQCSSKKFTIVYTSTVVYISLPKLIREGNEWSPNSKYTLEAEFLWTYLK